MNNIPDQRIGGGPARSAARCNLAVVAVAMILTGCGPKTTTPKNNTGPTVSSDGMNTTASPKPASYRQFLPDAKITPGAILPVTKDDICVPGYSKKVRNVPIAVKRKAYEEYNIATHQPGEYEVDHLISLELGGSNSIRNLWPESFESQPWNAHVKDDLENKLHQMVCKGDIDLATAQHAIATDWIAAYKKYFHTTAPIPHKRKKSHRTAAAAPTQ